MKKIPSLFKRDYEGTRLVYNEVVEGSEWVINGGGIATEKIDGTCCMIKDCRLYKRYDAKVSKTARKRVKREGGLYHRHEFKEPDSLWIPAQDEPDYITGHFPGWLPVSTENTEDKYHVQAWKPFEAECFEDGTYELVGKKIQSNPYNLRDYGLIKHGGNLNWFFEPDVPRTFDGLFEWLSLHNYIEGIVWHHPDGRMAKIKRKDFGLEWPLIASGSP